MGVHLYQCCNKTLDQAAKLFEKDMFLLGATLIEDKLQEGIPDTIHTLQEAGIKIWVLTGDQQETVINIGVSCRLAGESMSLVVATEETAREMAEFIEKWLNAIGNQRISGEVEDSALVIGHVSPLQKALVVKLVKKSQNSILLVIEYGANDVSMIQAAHVGVGIRAARWVARSTNIMISQFRYRKKLLVHGAWSFQLILYSFYKNMTLYMTQFWFSGTALYLTVLLTVLGKAALISDLWIKYNVAAIPGSFVCTMVFLPLYALVTPAFAFSTEYAGLS
ncbi:HAD-like domain-containing protein [Boletus coccyginus]|nr:HAD-like domain-containing protein [Boletus coccyginus]